MKIILLKDVEKLGKAGDVRNVAAGYGRNYLLPKKYAILATPNNMKRLESIKKTIQEKEQKALDTLRITAIELNGMELHFHKKVDENGRLYGSVSDTDMMSLLKEKGYDIHKSMISGEKHIKDIGSYDLTITFAPDVKANIKVIVQGEE